MSNRKRKATIAEGDASLACEVGCYWTRSAAKANLANNSLDKVFGDVNAFKEILFYLDIRDCRRLDRAMGKEAFAADRYSKAKLKSTKTIIIFGGYVSAF